MQTINNWAQLSQPEQRALLARPNQQDNRQLSQTVNEIIDTVRQEGDLALLNYAKKFEGAELQSLILCETQKQQAISCLSAEVKQAIDLAYQQIKTFHQAQKIADIRVESIPGVVCEMKQSPLETVGLYIPGGTAPLPSTVLMLGATAQVAGNPTKILTTPANSKGQIAAEIIYAAQLCDIDAIYLCGGAQAVAAMAYGTETIPKVDKIFGPGNAYVTEAKQQVSADAAGAAIDMPAGPSEVLVIADASANPAFVAADLLSQAEHGTDSQSILISDSLALLQACVTQLEQQLVLLSRADIARASLQNARFILTQDLTQSVAVSNSYAPEHLIVQTKQPRLLLEQIKHAGSIFLGPWSPESAGDYASGTNHVLPTYGYARNYSSLGLADFCRRYTVQELSYQGLNSLGDCIMTLAQAEGLDAHKNAVAIRLQQEAGNDR